MDLDPSPFWNRRRDRNAEPQITVAEVRAMMNEHGRGVGLTVIQDSAGAYFFGRNKGVNDAGTGLEMDIYGRIVYDDDLTPIPCWPPTGWAEL